MWNRSGMVNFIPFMLTRTRENHSWCLSWENKVFRNASTYVESAFSKNWKRCRFRLSNHVESIGHGQLYTIHANENSRKSILMLPMTGQSFQKRQRLSRFGDFKNFEKEAVSDLLTMWNRSGMVNFIPFTLTRTRENHSWCLSRENNVFRNTST